MSSTSELLETWGNAVLAAQGPEQGLIGSLISLLVVAAAVAILVKRIRLPYSVALVVIGLILSWIHVAPAIEEVRLTHDFIFFVLLPPLLFQGSLHMDLSMLRRNLGPIAVLALPGVIFSTVVVGILVAWLWGLWDRAPLVGLLFGAMVAATDPVSVLAIFRQMKVPPRLRYIVEGESLLNDGTAVVLFGLILGLLSGHARDFHPLETVLRFLLVCAGGIGVGLALGYLVYRILARVDDHLIEVSITVILAYGSFLLAENFPFLPKGIHLSGVLATVTAGLILGNFGTMLSMSKKTRTTVLTFWEVADFMVNSVLFILIGVQLRQVRLDGLQIGRLALIAAVAASLLGRALTVYGAMHLTREWRHSIPFRWCHVFFWGGLRGSIPIALVLGLAHEDGGSGIPFARELKAAVFALVFFSTVIQGLTMKPLLRWLDIRREGAAESAASPPPAPRGRRNAGLDTER